MGFFSNLFKGGSDQINNFFWGAWKAYVFMGDDEGRASAIAACIVATKDQRESMIKGLNHFGSNINKNSELPPSDSKIISEKINSLIEEIIEATAHNPGLSDVSRAHASLKQLYPSAQKALASFNGSYFDDKYPELKS